jgi:hypothetical protein
MKNHSKKTSFKFSFNLSLLIAFFIAHTPQILKAQKLQWAAVMGGNEQSSGKDVAMDKTGNVFSVGWYSAGQSIGTIAADFDPGPGQVLFSQSGNYLSKLNANGTYGFVKRFANTVIGGVQISQIALDSIGNIFLAGNVYLTADLDPGTPTVMYTDSTTGNDLIVYKFNPLGIMQWYKIWPISTINPGQGCQINELELDKNGNIILVGDLFGDIDFDLGPDTASSWGHPSFQSSFLLKLDGNGNYLWDYTLDINTNSSTTNSMGNCAINNQNEIYVVGGFWGYINFFSPDTFTLTANGFYDNFILKIDETGNLQWAKSFGGGAYESVADIHFSNDGNLYIAAAYSSPTVVLANDTNSIVMLGDSINTISALIKMNESGNYEWVRYLKNANLQQSSVSPIAIVTDSIGQVYFMNVGLTGITYTNYGMDTSAVYSSGETCSFVNKYTADGTFIRSSAATGDYRIFAKSMAMNKYASIAFTGELMSRMYIVNDPNPNPIDADPDTSHFSIFSAYGTGEAGIFVIKWNQCNVATTIIDTTVCNSFSFNGNNYTQSGTYNFYETTGNRCDSNAVLNLTILPTIYVTQNIQLCAGDSLTVNNHTYTQSGIYQDIFVASNGCDSTLTTTLFVDTLQAQIQDVGLALKAANTPINATFQWLDCNNNYQAIIGETNQTFTPISNGSYTVILNNTSCIDTSDCYNFVTVGEMNISDENNFIIAPNPIVDVVFIKTLSTKRITQIRVIDLVGKEIYLGPMDGNSINLSLLESGCYIIEILSNNIYNYRSIIKL